MDFLGSTTIPVAVLGVTPRAFISCFSRKPGSFERDARMCMGDACGPLRRDVAAELRAIKMDFLHGGLGRFRSVDRVGTSDYLGFVRHEFTDEISLAMGRRVAARLGRQPELLQVARENLDRWVKRNAEVPSLLRCYAEWRAILERPLEEICRVLNSDSEEAGRLRQNSPFAGVLSPQEVWELKRRFRHETAAA